MANAQKIWVPLSPDMVDLIVCLSAHDVTIPEAFGRTYNRSGRAGEDDRALAVQAYTKEGLKQLQTELKAMGMESNTRWLTPVLTDAGARRGRPDGPRPVIVVRGGRAIEDE